MSRILHLSDPHFGAVSHQAAEVFLHEANGLAPDLTILSGDLTMRARRGELGDAKRFVDSLPTPLLVIPGNHDIPALNQPFDRFFAPFRRYRETVSHDLSPTLRVPGIHAVGVNSSIAFGHRIDWSTGHLNHADFRHIAAGFTNETHAGDLRVLVLHHPLLAPPGHRRAVVQPMPRLLETMSRHRVDLVLCGHFHLSHAAVIGTGWSTVVSQAPTVCSTRLQGEPPGFHLITKEADELAIELRQFDGDGFTPSHTKCFRRVEVVHVNRLLENKPLAQQAQVICLPGGFSYGDDLAAGRIVAGQIRHHLLDVFQSFRDQGKLILGICNGFQILLKSGLLAAEAADAPPPATLTWNDSGRFEDRWVHLATDGSTCPFLNGIEHLYLPIAHAEGKFVARDAQTLAQWQAAGQLTLRYVAGSAPEQATIQHEILPFPANPNGSQANVAGACDASGRVFGLMPHPERFVHRTHHPHWTRLAPDQLPDGLKIFQNAVAYFT